MRFRAWAKRKAAKKHPKGDFRYRMTKDTLEIAVVHEEGEAGPHREAGVRQGVPR